MENKYFSKPELLFGSWPSEKGSKENKAAESWSSPVEKCPGNGSSKSCPTIHHPPSPQRNATDMFLISTFQENI